MARAIRRLVASMVLAGCGSAEESAPIEASAACVDPQILLADGACIRPGIPADGCAVGFVHDGVDGCTPVLPAETCPFGTMAVPGDAACRPVMPCGRGKWGDIPIDATTIYVDRAYTGSGSDGSAARPWTTIGSAVMAAPSGALIAIAEGSYREDVRVSGKTVRLWGVCPERVEIEATGLELSAVLVATDANGTELHGVALRGPRLGFTVSGSQGVLADRVWVHDNQQPGIHLESFLGATSVTITGSLVERNGLGVHVDGPEVTIDGTVVRGGVPGTFNGRGISMAPFCFQGTCDARRPRATVRRSVVEDNVEVGVLAAGSDLVMEGAVVRRTVPRATDQSRGQGVVVQACGSAHDCIPTFPATAIVRGSVVEENHDIGISVLGADATLETSVVRATRPGTDNQTRGRGFQVGQSCAAVDSEIVCDPTLLGRAVVRSSLVDDNLEIGVLATAASLVVERSVVRDTSAQASDGLYGDGIAAVSIGGPAALEVVGSRIERSPRAGVASFGASVSLGSTMIACTAFDLDGEAFEGFSFSYADLGGNRCGCPTPDGPCKQVTAGLQPPAPL